MASQTLLKDIIEVGGDPAILVPGEDLDLALGQLPYDLLSRGDIEALFAQLVRQVVQLPEPASHLAVLADHWESIHATVLDSEAPLNLHSWIFLRRDIPIEDLQVIAGASPQLTLIALAGQFIDYEDSPSIYAAMRRALVVFPAELATYYTILEMCGTDIKFVRNAVIEALPAISPLAPIPGWVSTEVVNEQETGEEIRRLLANPDNEQRLADRRLIALLGPPNPDQQRDEWMFISNTYDIDIAEQPYDWFTGYCEVCLRRIRRRVHALRAPMPYGGWKGCFCSWQHVVDYIEQGDILLDTIVSLELARIIKETLDQITVLDRHSAVLDSAAQRLVREYSLSGEQLPLLESEEPISEIPQRAPLEEMDFQSIIGKYYPRPGGDAPLDNIVKMHTAQDFANLMARDCPGRDRFTYMEGHNNFIGGYYDQEGYMICKFDHPVVLLVMKRGCPYCIRFKPRFIEYAQQNPAVTFGEVNDGDAVFPALVGEFAIKQYPSVVVFPPFNETKGLQWRVFVDSAQIIPDVSDFLAQI